MQMRRCHVVLTLVMAFASIITHAQELDARAHRSVVEALQLHIEDDPSVFPLEGLEGGIQNYVDGLRLTYYGYGERRYTTRTDFHPAFDVGYFPEETGNVKAVNGQTVRVRSSI